MTGAHTYRVEYQDGAAWRTWAEYLYRGMAENVAERCRHDPALHGAPVRVVPIAAPAA